MVEKHIIIDKNENNLIYRDQILHIVFDLQEASSLCLEVINCNQINLEINLKKQSKVSIKIKNIVKNKASGKQLVKINHLEEFSESEVEIKSVFYEPASWVGRGVAMVAKKALKSKANMTFRSLNLSSAKIDIEPVLEIHNNQVKCQHSNSLEKINKKHLEYLKSRGIEAKEAKKLLIKAFLYEK